MALPDGNLNSSFPNQEGNHVVTENHSASSAVTAAPQVMSSKQDVRRSRFDIAPARPDTSSLRGKIFKYRVSFEMLETASNALTNLEFRLPAVMPLREVMGILEQLWEMRYVQQFTVKAELQIAILKTAEGEDKLRYNFPVGHYFKDESTIVCVCEAHDYVEPVILEEEDKIPVTVVTGFLGSGKTTLMNHILTNKEHQKKIMVIQNEFGSVDIDGALVQEKMTTKEDIQVLDNGCMCCTVRGDLVKALNNILNKMQSTETLIDGVLIETTGMADPGPVIKVFQTPGISQTMRIDSVLTVVDVNRISEQLERPITEPATINEAVQQVIFADKILLNKSDKANPEIIKATKQKLKSLNAFAKLTCTSFGRIDLDKILNVQGFSLKKISTLDILNEDEEDEECHDDHCTDPDHNHDHKHEHHHDGEENCTDPHHHHGHGHGHHHKEHDHHHKEHGHGHKEHGHHHHDHEHKHGKKKEIASQTKHSSGVSSVGIKRKGLIELGRLQFFLRGLLQRKVSDLYRLKGILAVPNDNRKFVLHGIHEDINADYTEAWKENEEKICRMVFIGKDLDKERLLADFEQCFVEQKNQGTKRNLELETELEEEDSKRQKCD